MLLSYALPITFKRTASCTVRTVSTWATIIGITLRSGHMIREMTVSMIVSAFWV